MIREFGKSAEANTSAANIAGIRPADDKPESARMDETMTNESAEGLRPFHGEADDEESGVNAINIVGGILALLLIGGGAFYAYETLSHNSAPQQVALKTPTTNPVTADQAAAPPAPALEATAPDNNAAPQPMPAAPVPKRSRAVRAANDNAIPPASAAPPASATASADPAINAPMTLTPDTAPPPQSSAPAAGQTAMQQPLAAPNVSDQSGPPAPAMANNALPGLNLPSGEPQTPAAQLPADKAQEPAAQ